MIRLKNSTDKNKIPIEDLLPEDTFIVDGECYLAGGFAYDGNKKSISVIHIPSGIICSFSVGTMVEPVDFELTIIRR